jgi:hypothetical protein
MSSSQQTRHAVPSLSDPQYFDIRRAKLAEAKKKALNVLAPLATKPYRPTIHERAKNLSRLLPNSMTRFSIAPSSVVENRDSLSKLSCPGMTKQQLQNALELLEKLASPLPGVHDTYDGDTAV